MFDYWVHRSGRVVGSIAAAALIMTLLGNSTVHSADAETIEFTDQYLADEKNVALGQALWQKQCRHCHGASAYPGKAPKLKPRKYKPDFVYDRVTNGFRKMPGWKEVFSVEERMAIVAFVKSRSFSP